MHVRTRWGLATGLVALAISSNVLLMLPAFSRADVQVPGSPPQNLDWQPFLVPEFGTRVDYPAGIFSCRTATRKPELDNASTAPTGAQC